MHSFLSTGLAGFLTSCIIIGRSQTIGRDVYSTDRGSPTGIPVAMDHDDNTPTFRTDRSGCSVSAGLRVFLLPPDSDVCLGHTRSSRRWQQQKIAPPIAHKQNIMGQYLLNRRIQLLAADHLKCNSLTFGSHAESRRAGRRSVEPSEFQR